MLEVAHPRLDLKAKQSSGSPLNTRNLDMGVDADIAGGLLAEEPFELLGEDQADPGHSFSLDEVYSSEEPTQ